MVQVPRHFQTKMYLLHINLRTVAYETTRFLRVTRGRPGPSIAKARTLAHLRVTLMA